MNKHPQDTFSQFFKDARYYERPLLNGHHYGVRTPEGTFLAADDTEALLKLYEAAVAREEQEEGGRNEQA